MRVLTCAVVAAAASANALVGCFEPTVADCQFACGPQDTCPTGTSCMGGYCRDTTTGTCSVRSDARVADDGATGDGGACPTAPCGAAGVPIGSGECAAYCSQQLAFAGVLATCGSDSGASGWHIAIVDSDAERTTFGVALPNDVGWVGLAQTAAVWRWLDPSDDVQAPTEPPWASGEPVATNPYGLFDSTSQSDLLRSGTSSEAHGFFCEYRP